MVYIRTKKISGKKYAYLVENIKTKEGPRQKVKQYLGKVFDLNVKNVDSSFNFSNGKKKILLALVMKELNARGFKKNVYENLMFDPDNFVLNKINKSGTQKEAILACNDGYLCTFTLQRLFNFKKTKDVQKDGYLLAKYFQEAGLTVDQDVFVKFYQSLN